MFSWLFFFPCVKLLEKLGATFWAFASHFADLTLVLCPLGLGWTRRFPFCWQTLYLSLFALKRPPLVALYLNATVKVSTLNGRTCVFTRVHGATQRPGSGGSSGAGRCLLTTRLLFLSDSLHFCSALTYFQRTLATRSLVCPLLGFAVDVRASRGAIA